MSFFEPILNQICNAIWRQWATNCWFISLETDMVITWKALRAFSLIQTRRFWEKFHWLLYDGIFYYKSDLDSDHTPHIRYCYCLIQIERVKTTSMEQGSTRVLVKQNYTIISRWRNMTNKRQSIYISTEFINIYVNMLMYVCVGKCHCGYPYERFTLGPFSSEIIKFHKKRFELFS